jgi:anti-sigma regulatory factor (Ser/Thr protein kinase)
VTDDRELRWDLPWDDTAPAQARRLLASALGPRAADDLLLIASELVTNAYRHGLAPLLLCARQDDTQVEVEIEQTASEARPEVREASDTCIGGRGLSLVNQLADAWQWTESEGRLRVSAILRLR